MAPYLLFAGVCSNALNTIQTEPVLINNIVARNFKGLKLSVEFQLIGDIYYWTHPGLISSEITLFSSLAQCRNRSEYAVFWVTCQEVFCQGSTFIISSLTVMLPLDKNITFAVYGRTHSNSIGLPSIDIDVKGKFVNIKNNLYITYENLKIICDFLMLIPI